MEGLLSANALMQLAMMGVRVIGPAAAGALVAVFGASVCYTFDVISFLGSAALIGSVAIVRPPTPPRAVSSNSRVHAVLHDMSEGMRFIVHHPALSFVVLAMAAGLFTIGCFGPLIAVYVREWLHGSSAVFGVVSAMVGAGMLAGTPAVRRFAVHVSQQRRSCWRVSPASASVRCSSVPCPGCRSRSWARSPSASHSRPSSCPRRR